MGSFKDLIVYKKAFELAMNIFEMTKQFPSDEKFGLTSQIRRSSRSVCSNLAEGFRKTQYPAHFVAKMSDADMACKYITIETYYAHKSYCDEIGKLLNNIIKYPEKYNFQKSVS